MSQEQQYFKYYVCTVDRSEKLGLPKELKSEKGARVLATDVTAIADEKDKTKRPTLTYSLSLDIPETGHDVAIAGESSSRAMEIPKQIWVFRESPGDLVTDKDVEAVIRILKQDYVGNPLTLYFE